LIAIEVCDYQSSSGIQRITTGVYSFFSCYLNIKIQVEVGDPLALGVAKFKRQIWLESYHGTQGTVFSYIVDRVPSYFFVRELDLAIYLFHIRYKYYNFFIKIFKSRSGRLGINSGVRF